MVNEFLRLMTLQQICEFKKYVIDSSGVIPSKLSCKFWNVISLANSEPPFSTDLR